MTQVKAGDKVRIHYTGTLADGTTFDSSQGRDPLEFTVGSGQIISGLDREVEGMKVGDKQTVTVPAEEAYGAHDPAKVQQVPRSALPPELEPQEGMQLQAQTPQGGQVALMITSVGEQEITVDANHPLAGKDLVFDIEMVEILQAA